MSAKRCTFCFQLRHGLLALAFSTALCGVASAQPALFRLEVVNTWSEETHPGRFPDEAHFSWLGGATHSADVSFWQEGQLASPGIVQMAERGVTTILLEEVDAAIAAGAAGSQLDYRWWFCPEGTSAAQCGDLVVEFEVDPNFPLVTLVTMLGPSPDWFVGVSGLSLREGDEWRLETVVELFPFDGGTRSANQFSLAGPTNAPAEPITRITSDQTQLIGPASLDTMRFVLVPEPDATGLALAAVSAASWRRKRAQTPSDPVARRRVVPDRDRTTRDFAESHA